MAGIGFELRKLLQHDSNIGTLQAYGYAGIISSGPWILSILGILILARLSLNDVSDPFAVTQFQVTVTYLIASSLMLSGFLQHAFTRYISDNLFAGKNDFVFPNTIGAVCFMTAVSGLVALPIIMFLFTDQPMSYGLLLLIAFVVLNNVWLLTNLLSGLKNYKSIVSLFALAYALTVIIGYELRFSGINGLLSGFIIGHLVLMFGMVILIYLGFPSRRLLTFSFLKSGKLFYSLMATGFLYNTAIWIDKIIFWYHPLTSQGIIGPLRASLVYDLPIFLAYLAIIPGMAVFLIRMETDFVEHYERFYTAVREGENLWAIERARNDMVMSARQGIFDIVKIQGLAVLVIFATGQYILKALGISTLYLHLLYIDLVATGLQVVLLGLINVFFYLDKRMRVLKLCGLFVILNAVGTLLSIQLGVFFFGYGFAVALLIVIILAMHWLSRDFARLEYETFMGGEYQT